MFLPVDLWSWYFVYCRKIGFVDIDLAEYAGAGPSTQRYILQVIQKAETLFRLGKNIFFRLSFIRGLNLIPGTIVRIGSCYVRHWPLKKSSSAYYLLKVPTFSSFFKDKKSKRSHKTVCLMIEWSGSTHLTSGSGSGRPKNLWIRIRIRIRNIGWRGMD